MLAQNEENAYQGLSSCSRSAPVNSWSDFKWGMSLGVRSQANVGCRSQQQCHDM